jgi:hypothetical protein
MDLLNEVLRFVEGDAKWWEDAGQNCEEIARNLSPTEQAKCHLLSAAYRERAKSHRDLVASIRQRASGASERT